jgi:hypothetical protein
VAKERYTRKWLTTRIDRSIVIYFMIWTVCKVRVGREMSDINQTGFHTLEMARDRRLLVIRLSHLRYVYLVVYLLQTLIERCKVDTWRSPQ